MLSRASSLEALLILRMCRREDLENAPPKFLLDEINRLEACETSSWKTLQALLEKQRRQFSQSTWEVIAETFLSTDAGTTVFKNTSPGQPKKSQNKKDQAHTATSKRGSSTVDAPKDTTSPAPQAKDALRAFDTKRRCTENDVKSPMHETPQMASALPPRDGPAKRVHGKRSHTESEQPHEEGMARKVAAASPAASSPQENISDFSEAQAQE